jgi:hypothetical protein
MAFGYENEYRFFVIPRKPESIIEYLKDGVLFIPVSIEMIKSFTFYPAPKSNNSVASQIGRVKYDAECKYIKERIIKSYPEAKVYKSSLYSSIKQIEKIEI